MTTLDSLLRAIWDRGTVATAHRMQSDSVIVKAASITNRHLHLFDNGDLVGTWQRMPEHPDEIWDLGNVQERAIEFLFAP